MIVYTKPLTRNAILGLDYFQDIIIINNALALAITGFERLITSHNSQIQSYTLNSGRFRMRIEAKKKLDIIDGNSGITLHIDLVVPIDLNSFIEIKDFDKLENNKFYLDLNKLFDNYFTIKDSLSNLLNELSIPILFTDNKELVSGDLKLFKNNFKSRNAFYDIDFIPIFHQDKLVGAELFVLKNNANSATYNLTHIVNLFVILLSQF